MNDHLAYLSQIFLPHLSVVDVQAALDDAYLAAAAEDEAAAALANATGVNVGLGVGIPEKITLGASSSSTAATGSSSAEGSTVGGPGDHRSSLLLFGDTFAPISSTGPSLTRSRTVSVRVLVY